jgi:plasmid stabilization system protein ParE
VTYRIVFTARARAEALEQFLYLAHRSPDAAARWYTGLEKAIAKLGTLPERHPIVEDESEQVGVILARCCMAAAVAYFASCFPSKAPPSSCTMSAIVPKAQSAIRIW